MIIIKKDILKTFLFVIPFIFVEFTNTLLVIIDRSISNSLGKTAIIVFSSFMTLNWAINTIQTCIQDAHSIVLVKDKNNHKDINWTSLFLELITSLLISTLIFVFAEYITYVYNLNTDARSILTILLKLKAIQLPIKSLGLIAKNVLKIENKVKTIFLITVISAFINIIGDLLSVKLGYNEIGIYLATVIATLVETILLFLFAKIKIGKIRIKYIKELIKFSKDLAFNRIIQRIVNIIYTHVASSFSEDVYAIHCVSITIIDLLSEISEGFYTGLLINYAKDIENKKDKMIKKVDKISIYGIFMSIIFLLIFIYPCYLILGRAIPFKDLNPFIWFYGIEFIAFFISANLRAYLGALKDTKAIRMMALIGGVMVRIPFSYLIKFLNLGLVGLSIVCGIDRIVRSIYLRIYIKKRGY